MTPVADTAPVAPSGLGRAAAPLWRLDPAIRFLNHGSFGATPAALWEEQDRWRRRMEGNPPRFFMAELPGLLRDAAGAVAAFVGTAPERLAFVPNATAGTNAVLRSLPFAPGDEIVTTDHVYNAVRQSLLFLADTTGVRVVEARIGMPVAGPEAVVASVDAVLSPRTRLVVVDHVASASAVILPVDRIAALCRARGVPCLVDGAHAPGLIDLQVDRIGADWYVGNGHKWLCGPKGAGFLAVADRPTPPVHPLPISHGYGGGFAAEFDKTGTADPSAALCLPAAIRLHEALGGRALRERGARLARAMAAGLAAALGTQTGGDPALFAAMAVARVPGALPPTRETATALTRRLREPHGFEVAVSPVAGALWLRVSAAPYTDETDADGLAEAVAESVAFLQPRRAAA